MGISFDRKSKCTSESEIGQLNGLSVITDQQVLRLEVTVENPVRVKEYKGLQKLVQKALGLSSWKSRANLLHVLLKIELKVFEHKIELLLTEKHLFELYNVWMLQVLQQ